MQAPEAPGVASSRKSGPKPSYAVRLIGTNVNGEGREETTAGFGPPRAARASCPGWSSPPGLILVPDQSQSAPTLAEQPRSRECDRCVFESVSALTTSATLPTAEPEPGRETVDELVQGLPMLPGITQHVDDRVPYLPP